MNNFHVTEILIKNKIYEWYPKIQEPNKNNKIDVLEHNCRWFSGIARTFLGYFDIVIIFLMIKTWLPRICLVEYTL